MTLIGHFVASVIVCVGMSSRVFAVYVDLMYTCRRTYGDGVEVRGLLCRNVGGKKH